LQFLTGAEPKSVYAQALSGDKGNMIHEDSVLITLQFADGSNGMIAYLAEGDSSLAKERIEIFGEGKTLIIEDFLQREPLRRRSREEGDTAPAGQRAAGRTRVACAVVAKEARPPYLLKTSGYNSSYLSHQGFAYEQGKQFA